MYRIEKFFIENEEKIWSLTYKIISALFFLIIGINIGFDLAHGY